MGNLHIVEHVAGLSIDINVEAAPAATGQANARQPHTVGIGVEHLQPLGGRADGREDGVELQGVLRELQG